jgi:hypothetical protein
MIKTVKKYLIPHQGNDFKPHLLREYSVGVLSVIGFLLFCTSLGSNYVLNKTNLGASVVSSVLVDLTNEYRLENNGRALMVSADLEKAALMKAKDMAENSYFAHISPKGVTPWEWFSKVGYRFVYAGENLAINFDESVDVQKAWIASPTHKANLINDKFDEIGIATYQGIYKNQPTTFVVQMFGKRAQSKKAPVVSPAVEQNKKEPILNKVATITPEVKGQSISVEQAPVDLDAPAPVLLVNETDFAVAYNLNENDTQPNSNDSVPKYSNLVERILVNYSRTIQHIYLFFIAIIYLVLILMVVIEFRIQHTKNIALAVLFLCFLGALAYINSSFVLSFF